MVLKKFEVSSCTISLISCLLASFIIADSIKREQANAVKVITIEAYENKSLTKEVGVTALPTLILYRGNQIVWKKSGVTSKGEIERVLAEANL